MLSARLSLRCVFGDSFVHCEKGCPGGERTIVMSCGLQMDKTLTCHVSVSCCFLLKTTLWTCGREFQEVPKFAFGVPTTVGFGFLPVSSPSPIVDVMRHLSWRVLLRPSELTLTENRTVR